MSSNDKFCLRWNDFETNISSAFKELREDKDFFDVTLACDEDQVQAHKVILSACSPFFKTILRRNRHEHPLLYLKGVQFHDLVAVLNFMYHGEVNVAQEELNSFFAVAEELKVKGLTQNSTTAKPQSYPTPPPFQRPAPPPPQTPKRPRPPPPPPPTHSPQSMELQEVGPVKCEPLPAAPQPAAGHSDLAEVNPSMYMEEYSGYDAEGYEDVGDEGCYDDSSMVANVANADGNKEHVLDLDLDEKIERKMNRLVGESGEGVFYSCDVCARTYKDKTKMKHHIETHLDSYQICPICQQHCKTRRTLKTHMARTHSNFVDSTFDTTVPEIPEIAMSQ